MLFFDRFPGSLILPWSKSIRIKALYGIDSLVTKIASGATTGALGAFLANPVVPWTPRKPWSHPGGCGRSMVAKW